MTLKEAILKKQEADTVWNNYIQTKPKDISYDDLVKEAPLNITNYNVIMFRGGIVVYDCPNPWSYPPGVMAISSIPEEWRLTKEDLESDEYILSSCLTTYDW